jgi:hypothetical protein
MRRFLKYLVTPLFLMVFAQGAQAGGNVLKYNDQSFALNYSYAFLMPMPDFENSKDPMHPKMVDSPAIVLSDKPLDAKALAASGRGVMEELDKLSKSAVILIVNVGPKDTYGGMSLKLPAWENTKHGDMFTKTQKLSINRSKPGQLGGRLVLTGDAHMHKFDPDNIAFVEADITFQAASPKALPPVK